MLIWRGNGITVVPIVVLAVGLANYAGSFFPKQTYPSLNTAIILTLTLVIGCGGLYALDHYYKRKPARVYINTKTGQEVVFREKHDLFFIPIIGWAYILVVLAMYAHLGPR
jgi:hypothetical protein